MTLKTWFIIIGVTTFGLFIWPLFVITEFSYEHAWGSAHVTTMARSVAEYGIVELGGVPVQNNGPLTSSPDFYTHWPPLFAILLGFVFSLVGSASASVSHAVNLAIVALQAVLLFWWLRRRVSLAGAAFGILVLLNAPVMAKYGHVALQHHLAILLTFGAVLLFHEAVKRPGASLWRFGSGCLLYALACFTTWEAILAWPGFILYAFVLRNRHTLQAIGAYAVSAVVSVVGTFALFAQSAAGHTEALIARFLYRAGIAAHTAEGVTAVHGLQNIYPQTPMWPPQVIWVLLNRLHLLTVVGLLALVIILFLSLRGRNGATGSFEWLVLAPLLAMFGISHIVLLQYSYIHEFAFLLGALPAALATGFLAGRVQEMTSSGTGNIATALVRGVAIAIPIVLIALRLPVDLEKLIRYEPDRDGLIALGQIIRTNVPDNGIVIVPWRTMVPTYYSRRHIVRGIGNLQMYRAHAAAIHDLCETCPYYAILSKGQNVGEAGFPLVWQDSQYWLVKLTDSDGKAFALSGDQREQAQVEYDWLFAQGLEMTGREDYAGSVEKYRQAIDLLPDHPRASDAYNNLGWSLDQLRRYDEAIAAYETALRLNPGHSLARNNLLRVRRLLEEQKN